MKSSRRCVWFFFVALMGLPLAALSQGFSRTETLQYHDNLASWVVGQTAKVVCVAPVECTPVSAPTGIVVSETTYDVLARPTISRSFGRLVQTLTYNADGTVATVKDGNNNVTTLGSWYRGVPRSVTFADNSVQSAVVNDSGWITSVTDENRYRTCYTYDAMGRITGVWYPSESVLDTCDGSATQAHVTWAPTLQVFEKVAVAEYGIPSGHWRQTISTGNGRKITYFDALWRPLLTREYDTSNEAGTQRFQRFDYDHEGRVTFASYPGTTDALSTGIWTTYDVLGRQRSVSADSELSPGLLTTTTSYIGNSSGSYTLLTTPAGQQTRTWFQMFDQPDYSRPIKITHPEAASTHITRDIFGKPTRIRRSNSTSATGGTLAINRDYTYNAYQELCRSVEPETGATLMGYDGAGNLTWSASGLPTSTACHSTGNTTAINARKAVRTYDARNRITALSFPDGLGDTAHTYTPDGLPASITAYNAGNTVTTQYTYNRRRLLTQERTLWNSINWPISYTYNANGHRLSEVLPGNVAVNYAPNALGQPTQAGTYATGVTYYPNGAIKQFTYGNGVVHNLIQNARQLPERSYDCAVAGTGCTSTNKRLDLTYAYDTVGNVSGITDNRNGRQTRSMSYDGLDRLTQTISPMFGTASYTYNALDNLTSIDVTAGTGNRTHTYAYNPENQLSNIKNAAGGSEVALEYDEQGNLELRTGQGITHSYSFDYGNRLRSVAGKASYVYDGLGRRVRDYTTGSKYSLYSQDGRLMYASDLRQAKVTQYIYLGGSLVAFRETPSGGAATVKYQHTDALGTPIAVTDAAKAIIETSEYEPYGQLVNSTLKDGPGYTGHVQDVATGLTYMQQRYYDPQVGLFLSVDPVAAHSDPLGQFNRYRYANSNPYNFTDPDGRQSCSAEYGCGWQPTPDNFFRDNMVGRFASDTLGDTIAVFHPEGYNPLSKEFRSAGQLQDAKFGVLLGGMPVARGTTAAAPTVEKMIASIAQGHANSGLERLSRYMSQKELAVVLDEGKTSAAVLGHAVHRATAATLERLMPSRFNYHPTRKFDFIDMTTGQALELTTTKQAASHAGRGDLVLYDMP
jgi:RHS repeat-associated protein